MHRVYRGRRSLVSLALATAIAASPFAARAATTGIWNAGSGEWTNAINWTSNPLYPSAPDDFAYFQSPNFISVTIASPVSVGGILVDLNSITFSSTTGGSITLSSTTGSAEILATSNVAGTGMTFSLPVNLASNTVITDDASTNLLFSAPFSGTGNLTLNGTGTVTLRGSNSAWNPASIIVNSGVLSTSGGVLTSLGNLSSGTVTVNAGASLDASGLTFSTASAFAKTLVLSGQGNSSSPGALVFGAPTTALLGTEVLNGPTTINGKTVGAILNIGYSSGAASAAALIGTGPLIKSGTGTMQINIPAAFTGGTQVNGGTLTVSQYGSLVGTGQITVNTGGKLLLTTPAGNNPAANSVSPNSLLLNGGTLAVGADISLANLFANAPVNGELSIETPGFTAGGTGVVDLSGLAPGSLVRITVPNGGTLGPSVNFVPDPTTHMLHFTGTFTDLASISDASGVPTNVDFGGGGTVTLNGTSSYTGVTIVENSAVTLSSPSGLGSSLGGTQVDGGLFTLNVPTAEPFTLNGGAMVMNTSAAGGTGSVLVTGGSLWLGANWAQTITLTGGTVSHGGFLSTTTPLLVNGGQLIVANSDFAAPVTANGGTVTVSSTFASTLTLNTGGFVNVGTSSSFSAGSVLMNGGFLSVARLNSFPALINAASTGGIISLNANGSTFSNIDFSVFTPGSDFLLGSPVSVTLTGSLIPDSSTHTLHFGGTRNTGTVLVNAVIGDVASTPTNLLVDGPGTIILGTANTYSGTTVVNGTLQINDPGALGNASGVDADGTFVNLGGRLTTGAGVVLATEKLILNGGAINVVSSGPAYLAAPSILGGTLTGTVSGVANFSTSSALLLSGANSFTGQAFVLSGGSVSVISPDGLGDPANGTTVEKGGTLTLLTPSAEPVSIQGGTFVPCAGYSGPITLESGMLVVAAPITSSLVNNGGTVSINTMTQMPITQTAGGINLTVFGNNSVNSSGGIVWLSDTTEPLVGALSVSNTILFAYAGNIAIQNTVHTSGAVTVETQGYQYVDLIFSGGISGSGSLNLTPGGGLYSDSSITVAGPTIFQGVIVAAGAGFFGTNASTVTFYDLDLQGTLSLGGPAVYLMGNTLVAGTINLGITPSSNNLVIGNITLAGGQINSSTSYSGAVASISGTLHVTQDATLVNGNYVQPVIVDPGVTLRVGGSSVTLAGVTGGGSLAVLPPDAVQLTLGGSAGGIFDSGSLALSSNAGPLSIGSISGGGTLSTPSNTNLSADGFSLSSLIVGGILTIRPRQDLAGTSIVGSLVLSTNGQPNQFSSQLDITDNKLILQSTDPTDKFTKLIALLSEIQSGDNGNTWTGTGITSSTLAAYAASGNTSMTLAVADNAFLHKSTFGGQPVDDNSLLVTIALYGDTNLDGSVDFNDLVVLEQYYNFPQDQRGWAQGNTTGNGNFADLVALEQNYGASLPGGLASPSASNASVSTSPVPEPASLAIALLAAPWLFRRKNCRHSLKKP